MPGSRKRLVAAGTALSLLVAGAITWALAGGPNDKPPLGLFTSLPILWNESGSIGETLDGEGPAHWVRGALEADHRVEALDTLDGQGLGQLDRLVMAQPRPLAPAENVALDDWVRGGGRLLLFADPLLTEHSRFAIGDRRRPQDVVLISPILRRWGIELSFDEDQDDAPRTVVWAKGPLTVRLAGQLALVAPGAPAACKLAAGGLVAECAIGKGRAVILADAAVLEAEPEDDGSNAAVAMLLRRAFR